MYVNETLTLSQSNCKHKIKQPQIINSSLLIWVEKGEFSGLIWPQSSELGYSSSFAMHTNVFYTSSVVVRQLHVNQRNEKFESKHRGWLLLSKNFQYGHV
jgi:hypothetical protein